jgi:hypothetical protein
MESMARAPQTSWREAGERILVAPALRFETLAMADQAENRRRKIDKGGQEEKCQCITSY